MPAVVREVAAHEAVDVLAQLVPLYEEAFPPAELLAIDVLGEGLRTGTRRLVVCEQDGVPQSFGVVLDLGTGAWLLEYLATDEALRGRGIGERLLETTYRRLTEDDATRLYLEVEPADDDAGPEDVGVRRLAWYERRGALRVPCAAGYAMPDQTDGGPFAMVLMVVPLGDSVMPSGDVLHADVRAIFERAYQTGPDDPILRDNLASLTC